MQALCKAIAGQIYFGHKPAASMLLPAMTEEIFGPRLAALWGYILAAILKFCLVYKKNSSKSWMTDDAAPTLIQAYSYNCAQGTSNVLFAATALPVSCDNCSAPGLR